MQRIIGTVSGILADVTIEPPGPPWTYFGVAQSMMPGVKTLAAASPCPLALALVAAHVLEFALKAYLSRDGSDDGLKHHDLNKLWRMAVDQGLRIDPSPPLWADHLSVLHNTPFRLRYSEHVHGIVSPGPEPMTSDLDEFLETVRGQLR
jgi:hypothetical protein